MSHGAGLDSFVLLLRRDVLLAMRRRSDVLTTFFFFVIVVSLFPLGIGPEPNTLRAIAPGVIWVAALLASMLALTKLFASDYADGSLEQMLLAPAPLALLVLAKVLAHWLVAELPLILIAPMLGLQFDLPSDVLVMLLWSLLLGTPTLSLLGAIGAALTLGVRGGGALLSVLVLPLSVPVLIFGAGAAAAVAVGQSAEAQLSLLAGFLLMAVVLAPLGTATALRIMLD